VVTRLISGVLALASLWCLGLFNPSAAQTRAAPSIPAVAPAQARSITLADMNALRRVEAIAPSPDGERYAVLVRQAEGDGWNMSWFVGERGRAALSFAGDLGEVRPSVRFTGHIPGDFSGHVARWAPDGRSFLFLATHAGETQIWRATPGRAAARLTRNSADVRNASWSADGRSVFFQVGAPRAERAAARRRREQEGLRFDIDLWNWGDLLAPDLVIAPETNLTLWRVDANGRNERPATPEEQAAHAQVSAAPVSCTAEICAGAEVLGRVGEEIVLLRRQGMNLSEARLYAWNGSDQEAREFARFADTTLKHCALLREDVLCAAATAAKPDHLLTIGVRDGAVRIAAEVNPEFANIALGRVERFEFDTPRFAWNEAGGALAGLYGPRSYGYILYPPDYDSTRAYPVFVDAYMADGFEPLGGEHPLHVYAAHGIVVVRLALPLPIDAYERLGGGAMSRMYDVDLGFPHMSMLSQSIVNGLEAATTRVSIDQTRVGIGGVSHGTFVPLYLMQTDDLIAAISLSSPNWNELQRWNTTGRARAAMAQMGFAGGWPPEDESEAHAHMQQLDIAEHVEEIEAPVLMHLAASEANVMTRLIRRLSDAGRPYDAYIFTRESHIKWQAPHLRAIMSRNLDWFRYWLQDAEDADPAKSEQYERWRELRMLQCRNEQSVRDYCGGGG
jgi:dipeptidyl aminopeptidase/acylaminoacyl peptidase